MSTENLKFAILLRFFFKITRDIKNGLKYVTPAKKSLKFIIIR